MIFFINFNDKVISILPRSGPMSFVTNLKNVMFEYGLVRRGHHVQ